MKSTRLPFSSLLLAVCLAFGAPAFSPALRGADEEGSKPEAKDGENRDRGSRWKDGDRERDGDKGSDGRNWFGSMMESLSEEEKAELRAAMDAVWHDPEVLAAREETRRAGEAYKQALRKSMENTNPKIRDILTKMMEWHSGYGGGRPPHRGDRDPGGEGPAPPHGSGPEEPKQPPFFGSLSEEDRQILKDAKEKADNSEAVKAAIAKKEAAETGEEKIEALRELRGALHKAMVEADPRVSEVLGKLPVPGRGRDSGKERESEEGGDAEGE